MSQSLSHLWVHIIFSTKQRHPLLNNIEMRLRLYAYIKAVCHDNNCYVKNIGGTEDHIHILTSLDKNLSISSLIEKIKKYSSKWIKSIDKNNYELSKFYWQSGYGVFSVSESSLERVNLYIKNQEAHHKKFDFKEELIKILTQHGVKFDEKYLWT